MFRCAILFLAVLGVASAALTIFRPAWATKVGLDVWNLPDLESRMAAAEQQSADLTRKNALVCDRIEAKEQVLQELLAERMTLLQAAAWFRRLDTATPEVPGAPPDRYPGRTEGERYCYLVMDWALSNREELTPSHAEEIRGRLQAELDAHLASHDGAIVLPDVNIP
jgi:hypothetical protein